MARIGVLLRVVTVAPSVIRVALRQLPECPYPWLVGLVELQLFLLAVAVVVHVPVVFP